jgi:hypothetical protein
MPSPSLSTLDNAPRNWVIPWAPSLMAWFITVPLLTAVIRPADVIVAMAGLLTL